MQINKMELNEWLASKRMEYASVCRNNERIVLLVCINERHLLDFIVEFYDESSKDCKFAELFYNIDEAVNCFNQGE